MPLASTSDEQGFSQPTPPPLPWQTGLAPRFIMMFLLIAFYDRLGPIGLSVGGLAPSFLGAAVGGLFAFLLLFLAQASWGQRTRGTVDDLVTLAFGRALERKVVTVVLGAAELLSFAVAVGYAAALSMESLSLAGFIPPEQVSALRGDSPLSPSWLYAGTAAAWALGAAVLGPLLGRIVSALLYAYMVIPAFLLGGLMLRSLAGLGGAGVVVGSDFGGAVASVVQFVFAFTALGGAGAVAWGGASRTLKDVRLGGLVGVVLAPPIVASLTLVTVIGSLGGLRPLPEAPEPTPGLAPAVAAASVVPDRPERTVYHRAVLGRDLGGVAGGSMLMLLTLTMLGPACSGAAAYSQRFADRLGLWSKGARIGCAVAGAVLVWPLMASGWILRLEVVFGVAGGILAPLLGLLGVAAWRQRHSESPNQPPGGGYFRALVIWLLGAAIGLAPYLGVEPLRRVQPAALLACAVAWLLALAAGVGGRSQKRPTPVVSPGPMAEPAENPPASL